MKYTLNRQAELPAYLQIYNMIRRDITSGLIAPGAKLPSKRLLADELQVSVITVEHAYALLADEGYIQSRQRSGYYAAFGVGMNPEPARKSSGAAAIGSGGQRDMDDFPFSALAKTMRRVLSDYDRRILVKAPGRGCPELKEAIAAYLSRSRGLELDPEQIIIGSGAEYLYGLLLKLFGRKRIYAIEVPSYQKIEQVYLAEGVTIEKLKLGSDGIESAMLQATKASILHISPYSSFPSGVSASLAKRQEYLRWVDADDRYIIEDDFESEFSVARHVEPTVYSMALKDNVIYMNTFSQTISPSLRVGYMVLPKALVDVFQEKIGFYSCTVPTFIQYVLAELIDGGNFERHINRVRRQKRKELNRLKSK